MADTDHRSAPSSKPPAESTSGQTWALVVVIVVGIAVSAFLAYNLRLRERRLFEIEFDHRARERARLIERELRSALEHVESIAALFAASRTVDREQFRAFSEVLLDEHVAIQGLGFNHVVQRDLREEYENDVRLEGFPGYRITERSPTGELSPAADRDEYVVVTLLEPLSGNEAALGYDIASEPVRREALVRARDRGEAAVTGRLTLVQETEDQFGVLICVPVYSGATPASVAERRERLRGYAVGVLRIGDLVNHALGSLQPTGIDLLVVDDSAPEDQRGLHFHRSRLRQLGESGSEARVAGRRSYALEFAGRQWSIQGTPLAAFQSRHATWVPAGVLAAGLISTFLLGVYLSWQSALKNRLHRATTARERAEELQAGFGRMLDESRDEIYVFDADSLRFVHVNRGARENLGFSPSELTEMTPLDLKPEMTPESFAATLLPLREGAQSKVDFVTIHRRKDGSTYDVEVHLQLSRFDGETAFVAVILDITERRRLEESMRQAQRIEALGILAGGIAHDFNNLLTAIMGYSELGLADAPVGSRLRRNLEEVIRASERAKDVVRQILTFSRRSPISRRPVEVRELVQEALHLIRASLPSTIKIRGDLAETCSIVGDPSQIHQVLMNLCTNAAHAMREGGGTLEVKLDRVEQDASAAARLGNLQPGSYARITVRDSGHGIPPAILDRIFDPFFTTKSPEDGTGMGLAVAHGIVAGHGGTLLVASEPGRGATFEVLLPKAGVLEVDATAQDVAAPGGAEAILVVDDEPALAELIKEMLQPSGYRIEAFTDSLDALETLRAGHSTFDLVITDHTMPHMTGTALARELAQIAPETPVILVSGYGEMLDQDELRDSGVKAVLNKPMRIGELTAAVRAALDKEEGSGCKI